MWLKFIFFRQQRRVEKTLGTDTFSCEADVCFLKSFFSQGTEAPELVMMCEVCFWKFHSAIDQAFPLESNTVESF
jgi:hypothetical protein